MADISQITIPGDPNPVTYDIKDASARHWECTCQTAASTSVKIVSVTGYWTPSGFSLKPGVVISVTFITGNSSPTPALNVGNTGAKEVYIGATTVRNVQMAAGTTATFIYTGQRWALIAIMPVSRIPTFDEIYPIGSIYMSASPTDPGELFGGTWEQLEDRFLLGASHLDPEDETYTPKYANGDVDGSPDAIVVSHTHTMGTGGGHTHTVTTYYNQDAASGSAKNRAASGGANNNTNISKIASGTGTHSHTINSEGSSGTDANMPPYLVVFMWKRIS